MNSRWSGEVMNARTTASELHQGHGIYSCTTVSIVVLKTMCSMDFSQKRRDVLKWYLLL